MVRKRRMLQSKATIKKTSKGFAVNIGKVTVGISHSKEASEHLKKELNKSSVKRKALKKVFRGFHR